MARPTRNDQVYAQKYGSRFGIPANVLLGLVDVETGGTFRGDLTSPAGARGRTQFMPGTARQYKVKIGNAASEYRGAAEYLRDLGFAKNPKLALGGYNGGPGNPQMGYANEVLKRAGKYEGLGAMLKAPSYTPGSSSAPDPGLPAPQASSSLAQAQGPRMGSVSQPLAPAFSAKVAQPAGYTAPPGVAPAGQQTDLRSQLSEILKADAPPAYQPSAPPVTQGAKGPGAPSLPGVGTNYGRVVVAPGANRGGVGLQKPVLSFLQQTAGIFGKPIQVTTGTNHNQFVAGTNRQSDHWEGNAVDIAVPVDGPRGDQIAMSALIAAGISQKKAQQMARQGGLYNVNVNGRRLQVIWKTNIGGNHHNHVHIGVR